MAIYNMWGTDVEDINPDEFCAWCEREVPSHYSGCVVGEYKS